MSVTAKEIARELGLSESAVSLALNNKPGVSTRTRQLVWKTAQTMGFDFTRKSVQRFGYKGTICMVVYKKSGAVVGDTPFFALLTEGVLAGCKRSSYDFVVRYLYEDDKLEEQLFLLRNTDFAGLILLATEMTAASLRYFNDFKMPIVLLDAYFDSAPYDCVLINNTQGAYLATEHLISQCKCQPGYLQSAYCISNFAARADGFYKAIRQHGMSASKSIVHQLTPSEEGAYEDMRELILTGEELARCYFADNDCIAIGALRALREAGKRVPEDVAVVGFDDIPMCESIATPLSTVHVPKHYLGEMAAYRLVQAIEESRHMPVRMEINTTLVSRKSC